jgi:hypothetical protein
MKCPGNPTDHPGSTLHESLCVYLRPKMRNPLPTSGMHPHHPSGQSTTRPVSLSPTKLACLLAPHGIHTSSGKRRGRGHMAEWREASGKPKRVSRRSTLLRIGTKWVSRWQRFLRYLRPSTMKPRLDLSSRRSTIGC